MRFLIGIITGAILTLLFATAMDAPTHPILDRTQETAAEIWNRLISTTSDSLFTEKGPAADSGKMLRDVAGVTPDAPPAEASEPPPTARAPAAGLPAPRSVDVPPPAVIRRPQVAAHSVQQTTPQTAPQNPLPEVQAKPQAQPVMADPAYVAEDPSGAPVWVPFHSLMSAEGFAARLARELNHDFQVERQGAGTYQVVFEASDPVQRAELLAQISEITGQ